LRTANCHKHLPSTRKRSLSKGWELLPYCPKITQGPVSCGKAGLGWVGSGQVRESSLPLQTQKGITRYVLQHVPKQLIVLQLSSFWQRKRERTNDTVFTPGLFCVESRGLSFSRSALRLGEEVLQLPAGRDITRGRCLSSAWLMPPWASHVFWPALRRLQGRHSARRLALARGPERREAGKPLSC